MKKGFFSIVVVAVVALGLFGWFKSNYNGMVEGEEGVKAAWSQVENVYQRRSDLIPNLVATVIIAVAALLRARHGGHGSHLLIKARHAFSHLDHKNVLSLSRCC